jgi:amidohydrolase
LGVISSRPGAIFAAGFFYRMELTGRGTHGATPEKGRNPLSAAGELAMAIERLHDKWNRKTGAVLSLCRSEGGHTSNVIPSTALLSGTFRCLAAGEGARLESELRSVARAVCRRRRIALAFSVDRNYRYPVLNSPECVERVRRAAIAMGRGVWREARAPSMASEDFAHMLRKVPGAMFRLGLGKSQPPLHSDEFDFPDRALENGIRLFVSLALGERGSFIP